MHSVVMQLSTGDRLVSDITAQANQFCRHLGDGLLQVFVPHATAGVGIFETGAGSEQDLELILESVLPRDAPYRHRHGSPGHGRDHVLPVFVAPSITVPVIGGRMMLGTWQSLVLVDSNRDNPHRQVRLSFIADAK